MINKKGISGVIAAVLMIALVLIITVVVWTVVRNMVESGLEDVGSCFDVYGKVKINNMYTCYDANLKRLNFSVGIEDIDVDAVVVSISGGGATKSYTITNEAQTIENLANYSSGDFLIDTINLPGKNGGLTYMENTFMTMPDLIQIAPIVNGKQCEVSDSLSQIDDCLSLA